MEIKEQLNKPYTEKERIDFIVEQNHQKGYEIKESETALEAWGYTTDELAQKEAERISRLSLTAADVERAIYKAQGLDFEDVIALVEQANAAMPLAEGEVPTIDIKALKIELKANNFYRGNPYIDAVGSLLGFTKQQLDEFFETNDYTKLVTPEETTETEDSEDDKTVLKDDKTLGL